VIRLAVPGDASALARLHVEGLPKDLLPRLGFDFLARAFYPLVLSSPYCFTLVHDQGDGPGGFVVFTHDSPGFMRRLRSRTPAMFLAALAKFSRDPALLADLTRCALGFACDTRSLPCQPEACPELFVIAMAHERRSAGIGTRLALEGLARLARISATARLGCLVKTSSEGAFEFYRKLGFQPVGDERRGARVLWVLHRSNVQSPDEGELRIT